MAQKIAEALNIQLSPHPQDNNFTKLALPLFAFAALALFSCGGSADQKLYPALPPSGAEAPLFKEINQLRIANGKKSVSRSSKLDAIAASESSRLAATGSRKPNVSAIRASAGLSRAGVPVGSLKDRGPETGSKFPGYWIKTKREKNLLLADWYRVGVGKRGTRWRCRIRQHRRSLADAPNVDRSWSAVEH